MALEPAMGVLLGLLVLHQTPAIIHVLGILLVVLAGSAAQRRGRRDSKTVEVSGAKPELELLGSANAHALEQ